MAEKMVSPGVFTQENDLSFLPQGIAQIGAGIIGPTVKGPAFVPTLVTSYTDFTDKFGYPDTKSYVPYTVRNYLKHSGRATVVRVAGIEGYSAQTLDLSWTAESGSYSGSTFLGAVIAHGFDSSSDMTDWVIGGQGTAIVGDALSFTLSGSAIYTCSLDPDSDSYVSYVLGTAPESGSSRHIYVYAADNTETFRAIAAEIAATGSLSGSSEVSGTVLTTGILLTGTSAAPAYGEASTPYILSQLGTNLFKFVHFNAGASDVYISIDNIRLSGEIAGTTYGAFNVLVRQIGDTDLKPNVLETFANCNLDPVSPNFIGRKIGDQRRWVADDENGFPKVYVTGDFTNKSKFIRVEMGDSYGATEVPFGFGSYYSPVVGETGFTLENRLVQKVDETDTGSLADTAFNFKYYLGFDQSKSDNLFVLKPIASTAPELVGSGFLLTDAQMQSGSGANTATTAWTTAAPSKSRRFSVALQGGFDGFNPTVPKNVGSAITAGNVMGLDCSSPVSLGTLAYRKAIDTLANKDEFDINMLVLPGILNSLHGSVITYANDMAEDRGDTFFLFDCVGLTDSVADAIDSVTGIDSNYSATYYPWMKMYDNDNTRYIWAPITVFIPAVLAFNDKVAAPWYAPAGLNRGGISEATQVYTRLTQSERDDLYDGRVNPIVTFISQGIVTWGQKTLQVKASALDRVNVRRLLIELKKYIASATKYLVFEQNTVQTRTRFLNIVNPYLDSVQQKQGLYTFKVVMDETNNTPDVIDRNEMIGTIWLQPTKTAEMIKIDFNITPTGAVFGQ